MPDHEPRPSESAPDSKKEAVPTLSRRAFYGRFGTSEMPMLRSGKWKNKFEFEDSDPVDLPNEMESIISRFHNTATSYLILVTDSGVLHVSKVHYRSQDGTGRPDTGTDIAWDPHSEHEVDFLNILPKKLSRLNIPQEPVPADQIETEAEEFLAKAQEQGSVEHKLGNHSLDLLRKVVEVAFSRGLSLSFSDQNDLKYLPGVIQVKISV